MAIRPMKAQDAAWYHMDGPVNLAMVTGVVLTKTPLDFEQVKSLYKKRLLQFEVFGQRVVERGFPVALPHWEDMPNFDIDQHIHHVSLPAPHDDKALADFVSDLASTPLDRERPLWQIHVVDEVNGGSALVMRYHHCIADGTAMNAVTRAMYDTEPNPPRRKPPAKRRQPERTGVDRLLGPALEGIDRSARRALATAAAAVEAATHPQEMLDKAALVLDGAGMLVKELLKTPDPESPLKGKFGLAKRVAWSAPVALPDIKAIGAAHGAKVNDVLVAGMTGALRTYLRRRGVDVDNMTLRATVPVDLRDPARASELGNAFGLVILELAVGSRDPWERLLATKANMDALKRSPEAVAIMTLFEIFGRTPKLVEDLAVYLFGTKASLVMTNVAGSPQQLYLTGVPIDRIMFWVPHPGNQLGMGVSILSYNGSVSLGVVSDAHLVPDPEVIAKEFNREFAAMLAKANGSGAKRVAGIGNAVAKQKAAKAVKAKRAPAKRPAAAKAAPAGRKASAKAPATTAAKSVAARGSKRAASRKSASPAKSTPAAKRAKHAAARRR
jgi:WS/DGAT/MGAT family acyltransferase